MEGTEEAVDEVSFGLVVNGYQVAPHHVVASSL